MLNPPPFQQRILEGLTEAVLLFDRELRLQYVNPAGETLFSISARHLLGQPYAALLQDEDDLEAELGRALANSQPFTRHEVGLRMGPDQERVVDFTAMPLLDPGQEPAILVELHPVDQLLRISREENLFAQQQATRKILRGLAHEIKNPLGGLRGAAQLLERQLDSEELKEYTQVIIDEADRLQNLVDRILGPNRPPRLHATNIHHVLEHVRSLISAESGGRLVIERDYDPSLPELEADSGQLIQAVLNIVRNAGEAIQGEGTITFRTRVNRKFTINKQRHDLVARIDISDTGPGIPEEMQDKIFFPMVTGRAEGTGLGLSIAQSLIQQHGGMVEFQSVPGNTVFSIYLPLK
jgi:two-component system nitrogen regulation sensor histidine kinase GlnL